MDEREEREVRIIINHKLLLIVRNVHASAIETYEKKKKKEKQEKEEKNERPNSLISCENVIRREDVERIYVSTGGGKVEKNKNRRDKNKSAWEYVQRKREEGQKHSGILVF